MTNKYEQNLLESDFKKIGDRFFLKCGNQDIYVILFEDTFVMSVSQEGKTTVTINMNYNNKHDMFLKQYEDIVENKMLFYLLFPINR